MVTWHWQAGGWRALSARCQTCYLLCFISHNLSKSEAAAAAAAAGEEAEKVSPPSSAVRPQASLLRPDDTAQNTSSVVSAGEVHARSIHFNHLKKKKLLRKPFFYTLREDKQQPINTYNKKKSRRSQRLLLTPEHFKRNNKKSLRGSRRKYINFRADSSKDWVIQRAFFGDFLECFSMFADFSHVVKLILLFATWKEIVLQSKQMQNRHIF